MCVMWCVCQCDVLLDGPSATKLGNQMTVNSLGDTHA